MLLERAVRADERLGRRALEEGAGLGVDGAAREVVGRGVAYVEPDGRVEFDDLDEVGRAEPALLLRRLVLRTGRKGLEGERAEERGEVRTGARASECVECRCRDRGR